MSPQKEDYARSTGQPRTVTLDGRQYPVGKLRPADLGRIQAWFKEVVPNPLAEAKRFGEGLNDEVAKHLFTLAWEDAKNWPPQFGSDQATNLLCGPDGQAFFLHLVIGRHLPSFTLEDAQALTQRIDLDEFLAVQRLAAPGETGDPKAVTTEATA